jgi:fructose-1,6-bisphosphatase I
MFEAIPTSSSQITFSTSRSSIISHLFPIKNRSHHIRLSFGRRFASGIRCKAVEITAAESGIKEDKRKKGRYALENLTTWLLKQEQAGNIDAELMQSSQWFYLVSHWHVNRLLPFFNDRA